MVNKIKEHILLFMLSSLFILNQTAPLYAQIKYEDDRFKEVDAHVSTVSKQFIFHPQQLVIELTGNMTNDYDKVRAFYVWLARNIEYDLFAYIHDRKEDQSVSNVLRSGKALCTGYSLLFKYFCDQANIPARIIDGYAKGYGYHKNQKFNSSNHAWNAVFIHGSWYLLDATWASGNPENISRHQKKINLDSYFLVSPDNFIKSHLPEDPSWQLLDKKISLVEFETLVTQKESSVNAMDAYDPEDYFLLNQYDEDLLSYKRSVLFNPKNDILKERLSFAYLYKGISLTDIVRDMEFNQLYDTVNAFTSNFYALMDSALIAIEMLDNSKSRYVKNVIRDELNYQKGIFNYEIGTELFIKAAQSDLELVELNHKIENYFEAAETHFEYVPATSIYLRDAKEYLSHIEDFRLRKSIEIPVD
ncbi:MAG: hypothetical protein KAQ62_19805 [Cyclobacteriaceae bacterium]|nr:hypothetical protein [Cyclobacteriaceae bacterium]